VLLVEAAVLNKAVTYESLIYIVAQKTGLLATVSQKNCKMFLKVVSMFKVWWDLYWTYVFTAETKGEKSFDNWSTFDKVTNNSIVAPFLTQ